MYSFEMLKRVPLNNFKPDLNIEKSKKLLHFIKFHEKVEKIKCPYFFVLMHISPCFEGLLLDNLLIFKLIFLKNPSINYFENVKVKGIFAKNFNGPSLTFGH